MKISVLCVFLIALLAMLVAETSAAKFRTAKTTAVSTSEDHGLAETSGSAEVDEDDALVETAANDDDDALVETEQEQRVTGGKGRRRRRSHGLAETSGSAEVDEDDALVETAANDDDDDALVETEQEQRVTWGSRRRRRSPSGGSQPFSGGHRRRRGGWRL